MFGSSGSGGGGKKPSKNPTHGRSPRRGRRPKPPRQCQACGTWNSTQWREGPAGMHPLCNACGIRYRRANERGRPFDPNGRRPSRNNPNPQQPLFPNVPMPGNNNDNNGGNFGPNLQPPPPNNGFGSMNNGFGTGDLGSGSDRRKRKREDNSTRPGKRQAGPNGYFPRPRDDSSMYPPPFPPTSPDQSNSFAIPKGRSSTFGMNNPFAENNPFGGSNPFGPNPFGGPYNGPPSKPNGIPEPIHPPVFPNRRPHKPSHPSQRLPPPMAPWISNLPPLNNNNLPPLAPGQMMPMPGFNPMMPITPGLNEPNMTVPYPGQNQQPPRNNNGRSNRNNGSGSGARSSQKLPSFKHFMRHHKK